MSIHKQAVILTAIVVVVILFGLVLRSAIFQKSSTSSLSSHTVTQVTDEGVTWLPEKQEIKMDKSLFKITPDGEWGSDIAYYKVGDDNGKDIILAFIPFNGPSEPAKIMLIRKDNAYTIICSQSTACDQQGVYNGPEYTDLVNTDFYGSVPRALQLPKNLVIKEGLLYSIGYSYSKFFFSDYEKQDDTRTTTLTKFADTPWGPLYAYNVKVGGENVPAFNPLLQQYVLKLADGEARTYQMRPQFVGDDNVLLATWNDGSINKDAYSWNMTNGGCGASGFVEVLPDTEIADLLPVGKTVNGETIYGFKNSNNATLRGHYEMLPNGTYYFYDTKSGESKQIPISIEEYNTKHGVVVYKDSFGRYDVFVNQSFGTGAECGKPVIYLYPTKTTPVSVQVGANITKSEPTYNNGWNVIAHPNGDLKNTDGKKYSSLFWEGLGKGQYPNVSSGFVVAQADLQKTMWQQTHQLGLNDKEAQDFMDFWMPKMPTTPYVRLTWFGTRQMDELAPLQVNPQPDTSIRLFLDFAGLDKPVAIPNQVLSSIERKGFTLVEWGGLLRSGN